MNMLLTLLTLIAIFLNDHTLGKAFDSQCNNEDIFRKDLSGMQSVKEMLSSDQENFYTYPLKSETNTRSNFERFSVSVRNDVSAFMQISVPNDIPAITTSNFKQLNVPTIATLIDLRTCDNSLFFYFDTITTTLTANRGGTHKKQILVNLIPPFFSPQLNLWSCHRTHFFLFRHASRLFQKKDESPEGR
jgi:hypothetical protein